MSLQTKDYEKGILKLLRENPKGLTTVEISRILNVHRHTATKYIYKLVGSGALVQRVVGPAKICYLKEGGR